MGKIIINKEDKIKEMNDLYELLKEEKRNYEGHKNLIMFIAPLFTTMFLSIGALGFLKGFFLYNVATVLISVTTLLEFRAKDEDFNVKSKKIAYFQWILSLAICISLFVLLFFSLL